MDGLSLREITIDLFGMKKYAGQLEMGKAGQDHVAPHGTRLVFWGDTGTESGGQAS